MFGIEKFIKLLEDIPADKRFEKYAEALELAKAADAAATEASKREEKHEKEEDDLAIGRQMNELQMEQLPWLRGKKPKATESSGKPQSSTSSSLPSAPPSPSSRT